MRLCELFNAPLPIRWKEHTPDRIKALFTEDDTVYEYSGHVTEISDFFAKDPIFAWHFNLEIISKSDNHYNTKFNHSQQIFTTVVDITQKIIKDRKPKAFVFSAKDPNNLKLYKRVVHSLLHGWTMTHKGSELIVTK